MSRPKTVLIATSLLKVYENQAECIERQRQFIFKKGKIIEQLKIDNDNLTAKVDAQRKVIRLLRLHVDTLTAADIMKGEQNEGGKEDQTRS